MDLVHDHYVVYHIWYMYLYFFVIYHLWLRILFYLMQDNLWYQNTLLTHLIACMWMTINEPLKSGL